MYIRRLCQSRYSRAARGDRGMVLILAVFAVVLLVVLAVGITVAVRVELLASRASLGRMQSLFLAEAGLEQARAVLMYDDSTVDTLSDEWGPWCEFPLEVPHELGMGYYEVQVRDACGRIDVNEAEYEVLARLTGDPMAAAAMVDWRDAGSTPRAGGAEGDYYAVLPQPYLPRNAAFQTLGEVLLVRGVTPGMFFGTPERVGLVDLLTVMSVSPNWNADGKARLDANKLVQNWDHPDWREDVLSEWGDILTEDMVRALMNWRTNRLENQWFTSLAQIADALEFYGYDFLPLIDNVCVQPPPGPEAHPEWGAGWTDPPAHGKVNVNTARPEVLAALPGGSMELASAIVELRRSEAFGSLREIAEVMLAQPGGRDRVFPQMIEEVTTKSASFIVESMGWSATGRGFRTIRALVRRMPDRVEIVRQSEEDWPLPPLEEEQ